MGPDVEQPNYKKLAAAPSALTDGLCATLLREATIADARNATPSQLRRGADVYASLKEQKTVQHYPEEWGPSDARKLTCVCGNADPNHMAHNKI